MKTDGENKRHGKNGKLARIGIAWQAGPYTIKKSCRKGKRRLDYGVIFLIAVSLAMDAFAVSISNGVSVKGFGKKDAVRQGLYFGGFQFLMPVIGWLLGSSVKAYIEAVDHWIAFFLLAVIGGNMIRESFSGEQEAQTGAELTARVLLLQAAATSIDALAVGISFAILDVSIVQAGFIIGVVSFALAFLGGILGKGLGNFLQAKATFAGGVVLILIGGKILVEHLFFMN